MSPAKKAVTRAPAKKAAAAKRTTTKGGTTKTSAKRTARRATTATTPRPASPAGVPEQIASLCAGPGGGELALGGGLTLAVSNLRKPFFPKPKLTKGDLLEYYARIAPQLLPALADRPLVLRRFPNGIDGQAFYQQKAPPSVPEGVRVEVVEDEGIETQRRLIGGDLATLLYIIQLGAVSTDPWHSRVPHVEFADYSIIDLDPGPTATFRRVVQVASVVKDVLDELKLRAVPKTSGSTGIHIVLPLPEGTSNDASRLLAELVATRVADRIPKLATVTRKVAARAGNSVYVDYLQNIRGKTVASVYAARARPDATVSTPLRWDEMTEDLDPREFTIRTVPGRVREVGDLWAAGMRRPNTLGHLVED